MLKLYSYFRSSAAYRVRIGLHWKRLQFETIPVHLVKSGGEQHQSGYRKVNPMGHVPSLDHDGFVVAESMAILDYLDQVFPEQPLFPANPQDRARVIQICEIINSGIQPLQNLKVNQLLEKEFGQTKGDVERWNKYWIEKGLASLEKVLETTAGTHCLDGRVTAADAFLVPQCFSARRFGVDTSLFPVIHRVEQAALGLEAFVKAHPEKQPDYAP